MNSQSGNFKLVINRFKNEKGQRLKIGTRRVEREEEIEIKEKTSAQTHRNKIMPSTLTLAEKRSNISTRKRRSPTTKSS